MKRFIRKLIVILFLVFGLGNIILSFYYTSGIDSRNHYQAFIQDNATTSEPIDWIESNPIYSTFNISTPKRRKRVTVLIIVSTAPRRFDRRSSIRKTWWQDCLPTKNVTPECIFMTDQQYPSSKYYQIIQQESSIYGDMRFQHLKGGLDFGMRFLHHMVFAMKHYEFDYFLRMDDDYFFCMNNFLQELPLPMEPMFHWGWIHQDSPEIARPEESMILFSRDLIITFLSQEPDKIKCHPLADQMIAEWTKDLKLTNIYNHDKRLHHTPIVREEPFLRMEKNLCLKYIGIHGCYSLEMLLLWNNRGPRTKTGFNLKQVSNLYIVDGNFDWTRFDHAWRYQPKLCATNPRWKNSGSMTVNGRYVGRQNS